MQQQSIAIVAQSILEDLTRIRHHNMVGQSVEYHTLFMILTPKSIPGLVEVLSMLRQAIRKQNKRMSQHLIIFPQKQ